MIQFKLIILLTVLLFGTTFTTDSNNNLHDEDYISFLNNETSNVPKFDPLANLDFSEIDYGDINGSKGRIWKDISNPEQEVWYGVIELTEPPFKSTKEYEAYRFMDGTFISENFYFYTWDLNFDRDLKSLTEVNIQYETNPFCTGFEIWLTGWCVGTKVPYNKDILTLDSSDIVSTALTENIEFKLDGKNVGAVYPLFGYELGHESNYGYSRVDSNSYRIYSPLAEKIRVDNQVIYPGDTKANVLSYKYILENDDVDDVMDLLSKQFDLEYETIMNESLDMTEAHFNYRIELLRQAYEYYSIDYDEELFSKCTVNCEFSEFSYSLYDFITSILFFVIIGAILLIGFPILKMIISTIVSILQSVLKSLLKIIESRKKLFLFIGLLIFIDYFISYDLIILRILNNYRITFKYYLFDKNILFEYYNNFKILILENIDIIQKYTTQGE